VSAPFASLYASSGGDATMSSSPSLNAPEGSFQGLSPAHFRQVSPSSTSIKLPSSPFVTEDTSLSDAFKRVHEFLSTGVADSRATWLQVAATLITDLHNGIRISMATKPFSSFLTLTTTEQSHLDNLVISFASLSKFFTDRGTILTTGLIALGAWRSPTYLSLRKTGKEFS